MSLMGDGYEKDTDLGFQVPERRFGNSGVVELICPRQHWYNCYGQGVQKPNMMQSPMISQQHFYMASAMPDRNILNP